MKKLHIGVIALMSLLLLAAIGWGLLWNYAMRDTVPEGVAVGGIEIGGMPIDDAMRLLDSFERSLLDRSVTVQANTAEAVHDSKQWTAAELGYRIQFVDIRAALSELRKGNIWERAAYRYHFPKSYLITQNWNRDLFEAALRQQWGWMEESEPKDATRTISENDEVIYEAHIDAYRLHVAELAAEVEEWILLKEGAYRAVPQSFAAPLPVEIIHPEVTLEKLQAEGIERKIMSFTTDFASSGEGRAHNVTVAAETLHDWHLAPDEVFEYSKLIEQTEENHTFREAPVIVNGRLTPGIGGGVCQVSSTLYQAVLRAGLEIVERRNHSIPVAYLPLGQDATYADGGIDFRFRNTTGKHLIIRTEVKDRKLTVKLFGTMPENERYDIESVTVKTIAPEVRETANALLPAGKKVTVESGKQGYVVDTFRTLIRDGVAVSSERVSHDTYRAQPRIVEFGTAS